MDLLASLIGPDDAPLPWWQMTIRGVAVFLFCTLLLRVLCRRAFGMHSYLDIALAVLIGSILSRAVVGNAPLAPSRRRRCRCIRIHPASNERRRTDGGDA